MKEIVLMTEIVVKWGSENKELKNLVQIIDKAQTIRNAVCMTQKEFNNYCREALANHEFLMQYHGKKAIDPWKVFGDDFELNKENSKLVHRHAKEMHYPLKEYNAAYVKDNLKNLGEEFKIFCEIINEDGNFDKAKFIDFIKSCNNNCLERFYKRLQICNYAATTQRGMYMIDDYLAEQVGEEKYWTVWGKPILQAA